MLLSCTACSIMELLKLFLCFSSKILISLANSSFLRPLSFSFYLSSLFFSFNLSTTYLNWAIDFNCIFRISSKLYAWLSVYSVLKLFNSLISSSYHDIFWLSWSIVMSFSTISDRSSHAYFYFNIWISISYLLCSMILFAFYSKQGRRGTVFASANSLTSWVMLISFFFIFYSSFWIYSVWVLFISAIFYSYSSLSCLLLLQDCDNYFR